MYNRALTDIPSCWIICETKGGTVKFMLYLVWLGLFSRQRSLFSWGGLKISPVNCICCTIIKRILLLVTIVVCAIRLYFYKRRGIGQYPIFSRTLSTPRIIFRNEPTFAYRCQPKLRLAGLTSQAKLITLISILSKGWAGHLLTLEPSFRSSLYGFSLNVLNE